MLKIVIKVHCQISACYCSFVIMHGVFMRVQYGYVKVNNTFTLNVTKNLKYLGAGDIPGELLNLGINKLWP